MSQTPSLQEVNFYTNRPILDQEPPREAGGAIQAAQLVFDRSFLNNTKKLEKIRQSANSPFDAVDQWWRSLTTRIRLPNDPSEVQAVINKSLNIRCDLGPANHPTYDLFIKSLGDLILKGQVANTPELAQTR